MRGMSRTKFSMRGMRSLGGGGLGALSVIMVWYAWYEQVKAWYAWYAKFGGEGALCVIIEYCKLCMVIVCLHNSFICYYGW